MAELRAALKRADLTGLLVPRADEHLNEYIPASADRLRWLTGFTGSAGLAIVLAGRAAVFTDGRYQLQIRAEVDQALFELYESHLISYEEALRNADSKNELRLRVKLESKREDKLSHEQANSLRIVDESEGKVF